MPSRRRCLTPTSRFGGDSRRGHGFRLTSLGLANFAGWALWPTLRFNNLRSINLGICSWPRRGLASASTDPLEMPHLWRLLCRYLYIELFFSGDLNRGAKCQIGTQAIR